MYQVPDGLSSNQVEAYYNVRNLYDLYVLGEYNPSTDNQNVLLTLNMDINSLGSKLSLADMPELLRFKQAVAIALGM